MRKRPAKHKMPRRKIALSVLLAGCLLVMCSYLYSYFRSPLRIVHQTISALRRNDADALLHLAGEKERRALNLTPQTVSACLRETGWSNAAGTIQIQPLSPRPHYDDVLMYDVLFTGRTPDGKPRQHSFYIYQDSSGKWRLGLSMLLFVLPPICSEIPHHYSDLWDDMARRSGIIGCTIPGGPTRFAANGSHASDIELTVPDS